MKCDYLLNISYVSDMGTPIQKKVVVRARLKSINGKQVPFFAVGDTVPIVCLPRFSKVVPSEIEPLNVRHSGIARIVLWTCCTVLTGAILLYML